MTGPEQAGEAASLGTLERAFAVSRATLVLVSLLSLTGVVLAVLFLIGLVFFVQVTPGQQVEALVFDSVFALPVILLVIILIRTLIATYTAGAFVFPDGMVMRRNGRHTAIRWEEIASVHLKMRRRQALWMHVFLHAFFLLFFLQSLQSRQRYSLHLYDGTVLKIPTILHDVGTLGALVGMHTARVLLPRARATYDIGGTVGFGALSLSRDGLRRGKKTLSLDELSLIDPRNGMLRVIRIGKKRPWTTVPAAKVPNIALLHALLDAIADD